VELAFGAGSWTRWGIELQRRLRYRTTGDIEHVTGLFLRYTHWP